jgi:hypothetical protein
MIELLIFGLVLLSVICLWLLIEGRKSPKFLIWFIPFLLILVASTYMTYTSLLGYPKFEIPKKGLYLKHHIDEPDWIYLWVIDKEQIPISYRIVYSRETHNALEGVEGKAEEGKFMVLGKDTTAEIGMEAEEKEEENTADGHTIGGDISFYEWNYESQMPQKNPIE